jgi:DNA-directed RNA polymerase subunit beta'
LEGKIDHLQGLKENVIVGKLIPAGTGFASMLRRERALAKRQEAEPITEAQIEPYAGNGSDNQQAGN